MRPLYLCGGAGMTVDYDEPALVVSAPAKSRQYFPVVRVSRVIVSGSVGWSMKALFACADAGVAVIFLTEAGTVRSRWLGKAESRARLLSHFVPLLQRPDAQPQYRDWHTGMRRMAVRSAARRLGFVDWRQADADSLSAWLRQTLPEAWLASTETLRGFVVAMVIEYLADFGLDVGDAGLNSERLQLADDLAGLLLWDFYPLLVRFVNADAAPSRRDLAALLDKRGWRCEQLLRGLLNRLQQCLMEGV